MATEVKHELGDTADMPQQYLTFMLQGELFGLTIQGIREIIEYGTITQVPMMPPFVRGIINLRGSVVPVIDLAVRFGKESSAITRKTCIVIVEVDTGEGYQVLGVVVDAVSAVLEIPESQIGAPPAFGTRIRSDFIQGMGKLEEKFVILLNIARVLSIDEMAHLTDLSENLADAPIDTH